MWFSESEASQLADLDLSFLKFYKLQIKVGLLALSMVHIAFSPC